MKKILYSAALVIAAISSCTKEEINNPDDIDNKPAAEPAPVFIATVGEDTKTSLNTSDKSVTFNNGDKISVNGSDYIATVTEGVAAFNIAAGAATPALIEGSYYAYYPSFLWSAVSNGPVMPSTWNIKSGSSNFNMPLFAKTTPTKAGELELRFYHMCGFISLTIQGGANKIFDTVTSITVSADNTMSGPFSVTGYSEETKTPKITFGSSNLSKFITFLIEDGHRTIGENDVVFYFPVPEAHYDKLMFTVEGSLAGKAKAAYMITKDTKPGDINRDTIYKLTFKNNFTGAEVAVATTEVDEEDGRY